MLKPFLRSVGNDSNSSWGKDSVGLVLQGMAGVPAKKKGMAGVPEKKKEWPWIDAGVSP